MLENENKNPVYACFILRGKDLDPQEVSDSIGIQPTKRFRRGDIRKGNKRWPHGYWELSSKNEVSSIDLSLHLQWLLNQLEPANSQLLKIIKKDSVCAEIRCLWVLPIEYVNLSIDSELLSKIAYLGLSLEIDIYCPD